MSQKSPVIELNYQPNYFHNGERSRWFQIELRFNL